MVEASQFLNVLRSEGVEFFTGVPDSLLQPLCREISLSIDPERHVIAANEGAAIALAAGWHLATRSVGCVYMQNSGLGNAINPLVSLADPDVYGIPMLLIVGWRGEMRDGRQMKDEPQHVQQGRITPAMLDLLEIPSAIVGPESADIETTVAALVGRARREERPCALIVRANTFAAGGAESEPTSPHILTREQVVDFLVDRLPSEATIVTTTGKLSRELYEIRGKRRQPTDHDFLTVGSMGHAVQIASGIAMARPRSRVVCLDGDGAMIMHMGALTVSARVPNLLHIVINNGAHDSVGGQPTAGFEIDMLGIARSCGYGFVGRTTTLEDLEKHLREALATRGAAFIEVRTRTGARVDLGRPKASPAEAKRAFMRHLSMSNPG